MIPQGIRRIPAAYLAADITLNATIANNRIFQRAPGLTTYALPLSGTYAGSPSGVQAQIVSAADGTVIVDWTTIAVSPTGGTWSGTITTPQGGWYKANVRLISGTSVASTATQFAVGMLILYIGQSNNVHPFTEELTPPTPASLTQKNDETQWVTIGGNGAITLANDLNTALSIPIGLLDCAIGSTTIASWVSGGSSWTTMTAGLTSQGITDFEMVSWYQGETDAANSTTKANYKARLALVEAQCSALCGRATLPFGITTIASTNGTNADTDAIRQGQLEYIDTNASGNVFYAYSATDQNPTIEVLHFTAAIYAIFGNRFSTSVETILGAASFGGAGPKITTAAAANGSPNITISVAQNGGTRCMSKTGGTSGTGLTGFIVTKNGSGATISSTTFVTAGAQIRLVLSANLLTGDVVTVTYQFGNPNVGNPVYDDNPVPGASIGRPLQPSRGSVAVSGL